MLRLPKENNPHMKPAKVTCRAQYRCTVPCEDKAVCAIYLVELESDQQWKGSIHHALRSNEHIVSISIDEEIHAVRFPGAALHEFQEMMDAFAEINNELGDLLSPMVSFVTVSIRVAHSAFLDWNPSFAIPVEVVPHLKKMIEHFRGFIIWTK